MNPAYILLAFAAMAGGAAIAAGYFAFISMIGIFPKLLSKIQYNRHYMLVENLLAYGAALGNVIYIFNIRKSQSKFFIIISYSLNFFKNKR